MRADGPCLSGPARRIRTRHRRRSRRGAAMVHRKLPLRFPVGCLKRNRLPLARLSNDAFSGSKIFGVAYESNQRMSEHGGALERVDKRFTGVPLHFTAQAPRAATRACGRAVDSSRLCRGRSFRESPIAQGLGIYSGVRISGRRMRFAYSRTLDRAVPNFAVASTACFSDGIFVDRLYRNGTLADVSGRLLR